MKDYIICQFSEDGVNAERVQELFAHLKIESYLDNTEHITIENICAKYSDIFHLPGVKPTVSNVYKQEIQLKDSVR